MVKIRPGMDFGLNSAVKPHTEVIEDVIRFVQFQFFVRFLFSNEEFLSVARGYAAKTHNGVQHEYNWIYFSTVEWVECSEYITLFYRKGVSQ